MKLIFFILFFVIISSIFSAPIDKKTFWELYSQHLINILAPGEGSDYIQILKTPIDATWDKNLKELDELGDSIPYWNRYYSKSLYKISEQYKEFVGNINKDKTAKNSQKENEFLSCKNELMSMITNILTPAQENCEDKYINLPQQPNYDTFMNECLGDVKVKYNTKKASCDVFQIAAYGILNDDLATTRSEVLKKMEWKEAMGTSLRKFRENCENGIGQSRTVNINFASVIVKPLQWQKKYGIEGESRFNENAFASIMQNPDYSFQTDTDRFSMKIFFKFFDKMTIAPKKWYNDDIIDSYKNGPFINKSPNYFGSGGTMRLKPTHFYVVYQPELEVCMNQEDIKQFVGSSSSHSGGFFSSSSELIVVEKFNKESDKFCVKVTSKNRNPEIFAIKSEVIGL